MFGSIFFTVLVVGSKSTTRGMELALDQGVNNELSSMHKNSTDDKAFLILLKMYVSNTHPYQEPLSIIDSLSCS